MQTDFDRRLVLIPHVGMVHFARPYSLVERPLISNLLHTELGEILRISLRKTANLPLSMPRSGGQSTVVNPLEVRL